MRRAASRSAAVDSRSASGVGGTDDFAFVDAAVETGAWGGAGAGAGGKGLKRRELDAEPVRSGVAAANLEAELLLPLPIRPETAGRIGSLGELPMTSEEVT